MDTPPGALDKWSQESSVPIEHYSYESVELLKDRAVRWRSLRRLRQSEAFADNTDPALAAELNSPDAEIYVIDVSFAALKDEAESRYLKELPTSFALPAEAVDRLRAAAGTIIMASPEFQRLLKDTGATIVPGPSGAAAEPK